MLLKNYLNNFYSIFAFYSIYYNITFSYCSRTRKTACLQENPDLEKSKPMPYADTAVGSKGQAFSGIKFSNDNIQSRRHPPAMQRDNRARSARTSTAAPHWQQSCTNRPLRPKWSRPARATRTDFGAFSIFIIGTSTFLTYECNTIITKKVPKKEFMPCRDLKCGIQMLCITSQCFRRGSLSEDRCTDRIWARSGHVSLTFITTDWRQ